jgi:hypothetical protein
MRAIVEEPPEKTSENVSSGFGLRNTHLLHLVLPFRMKPLGAAGRDEREVIRTSWHELMAP